MTDPSNESLELASQTDAERSALIAELQQAGIKHNPEKILRIAKLPDGQIVFLETGNSSSGLQHIVNNHKNQFADRGISEDQIPDALMTAIINGNIVGYQKANRPIYETAFNGKIQLIAVTVSENGYVVCANPGSVLRP